MNNILKLYLSDNDEDIKLAKMLLKTRKYRQLNQDLVSIAAFIINREVGTEPKLRKYYSFPMFGKLLELIPDKLDIDLRIVRLKAYRKGWRNYSRFRRRRGGLFYKKAMEAHKRISKQ